MGGVYIDERSRASVRDPETGRHIWVPQAELSAAIEEGFVAESPEEFFRRREAKQYDAPGTAGLAAGASSITLGLSDILLGATGHGETLRKLREHNPTASTVGDVGGAVAGALVPAAPLARAGAAAAKAAGGAGRAASVIARGAAEGAAMGAGAELGRAGRTGRLPERIAERALHAAAAGAAMSLAGLGIVGAAKAVGRTVAKRAGGVAAGDAKATAALLERRKMLRQDVEQLGRMSNEATPELLDQARASAAARGAPAAAPAAGAAPTAAAPIVADLNFAALTKAGASPKTIGRLTWALEDARLPDTLRTQIRNALTKGAPQRYAGRLVREYETVVSRVGYRMAPIRGSRAFTRNVDKLRSYATDPRVPAELREQLVQRLKARHELSVASARRLVDGVEEQVGYRALISDVEAGARRAARGGGALSDEAAAELLVPGAAERVQLNANLGGWRPRSGVRPEQLGDELARVEQQLGSAQTETFRQIGERLAASKGAIGAILGLGSGSWMLGGAGMALSAVAGMGAVQRGATAVVRGLAAAAPGAARGARAATLRMLSADDIDQMRTALTTQPADVMDSALAGFEDAGLPDAVAHELATFHADRAALLQAELPEGRSVADRARFSKIVAAAEDPRGILARAQARKLTPEDVTVMRRLLPRVYAQMQAQAQATLEGERKIDERARRQLQLLVADGSRQRRAAAIQTALAQREQQAPPSGGSLRIPLGATALQAAAQRRRG